MRTVFLYSLARSRGQIVGWGIAVFLLGLMSVPMWDVFLEQRTQVEQMLKGLPPFMKALMPEMDRMFTPEGFLGMRFFSWMPLLLGIFAVLAGSGLLAADEENGTLDLVLAHPLSRTELFLGRLGALAAATAGILAIAWLGLVVPMQWSSLAVSWGALVLPLLALLAVLLVDAALALLLSMVLPSRRSAAMTAGLAVVAGYFVTALARDNPQLETLAWLSPTRYYQSGDALRGLHWPWLGGLLAAAALLASLAWWRFERRDIRVAGEGSWQWPFRRRRGADRVAPLSPRPAGERGRG